MLTAGTHVHLLQRLEMAKGFLPWTMYRKLFWIMSNLLVLSVGTGMGSLVNERTACLPSAKPLLFICFFSL